MRASSSSCSTSMMLAAGAAACVLVGSDLANAQAGSDLASAQGKARLRCGDTITQDTVLRRDLDCSQTDVGFGLTVQGPATLDLGGHFVDCREIQALEACIILAGSGARLKSGSASADATAVLVAGDGGHTVRDVVGSSDLGEGFDIVSDRNHVERSTSLAEAPFIVTGGNNVLDGNSSPGLADAAHFLIQGAGNFLTRNSSSGLGAIGVALAEGADSTTVLANSVVGENTRGIVVASDRNLIVANEARDNEQDGIQLAAGAESNVVLGNQARGNGGFDLSDANQDCDANLWVANQFDDVNEACVALNLSPNP